MKLLFVCPTPVAFTVETPVHEPLGGTESALAYLAKQLASNGHDVTVLMTLPPGAPEHLSGVRHLPLRMSKKVAFFEREDFDAVIILSGPQYARYFKQRAPRAFHCAWLHMLPDQAPMAPLSEATPFIDCAVFVSESQRAVIPFTGASHVIGNGISPCFENMFSSAAELRAAKQNRAVYTTTPFRGLDVLAAAMAQARIETELDVYSSVRVYQVQEDPYQDLYATVNATPRCRHHGALGQKDLAEKLKTAAFLTYPCTFIETYCTSASEAMAAGLKVITTDLGALPETTLGFADLVPLYPGIRGLDLAPLFAAQMEKSVGEFISRPEAWAEERFYQVQTVNRRYAWSARAKEWESFLEPEIARRRVAG